MSWSIKDLGNSTNYVFYGNQCIKKHISLLTEIKWTPTYDRIEDFRIQKKEVLFHGCTFRDVNLTSRNFLRIGTLRQ